ncbi:MAG: SRPBCC family protein [Myxococcota bacterium]
MSAPRAARPDTDIVVERTFDAPRQRVFRFFTEPDKLKRWWAPAGGSTPHCTVDLRVGGKFHFCMRTADGQDFWGVGVYREIVRPERIVYVDSFADENGDLVAPSRYGMSPQHPAEALVTITFEEHRGRTKVTLRHEVPAPFAEREGTAQGWRQMLERLGQALTG